MYPKGDSYFGNFVKDQVVDLRRNGVEIIKVVKTSKKKISYLPFFLKSMFYLLFKRYDLIHAHYGFHSALIALIYKNAPLIITCHRGDVLEEPYRNPLYYWLQVITLKKATHIIAVSREIKDILISQLRVEACKISVISCGVDTSFFKPLKDKQKIRKKLRLPEDKDIVLFIGSLSYRKGIDVVFECAKRMQEILFILIGNWEKRTYHKLLEKIPPNCRIVGAISPAEIPWWLNASRVFLLPTRSEGTPVSLLEALACGVPAVTSRVGGIPEVMENGKTGWMISIEEIDAIISKIKELLNNKNKRNYMANYAREIIIKKFAQNIITQKIKNLYLKLSPKF
jgi:glycosyltransferase involved in cell wall biosynthesis